MLNISPKIFVHIFSKKFVKQTASMNEQYLGINFMLFKNEIVKTFIFTLLSSRAC